MFPMKWSTKILFGLIKFSYKFCDVVGFVPFKINFENMEIQKSKWKIVYCASLNVFMISLFPLLMKLVKSGSNLTSYTGKKPLVRIIGYVNLAVRAITFVFTIFINWRKRNTILEMITKLLEILRELNEDELKNIPKKYITALIIKYMLLVFQTLTWISAITNLNSSNSFTIEFLFITLYVPFMFLILSIIVNNFWILSLIVCIRYRLDNRKLRKIIANNRSEDKNECERIFKNHFEMENILKMVKDVYEFQVLSSLLGVMLMNITIWHYGLSMVIGNLFPKTFFTISTGLAAIITFIVEFYLMIFIPDECFKLAKESRELLKKIPYLFGNEGFDFMFNTFCLELEKYDENLGGLLIINKSTGFEMMAATFMNTIFLVQFDFYDLGI